MQLPHNTVKPPICRALAPLLVALMVVATLAPTGCVRRRLAVRSNPPGALVFVDNQQIGTTPCSVDFTYYGTREIRLIKPGFETLTVNQPIPTPWYQIPPVDFVSENLVPTKILDHRTVSFDLQPQVVVPTEQLLDRANQLRQETLQTAAVPPTVMMPGAVPGSLPPGVVPPGTFAPPPSFAPMPAGSPTPLPPVTEVAPPSTFGAPTAAPTQPPFSAPSLPTTPAPRVSPQIGPPIVSPALRYPPEP